MLTGRPVKFVTVRAVKAWFNGKIKYNIESRNRTIT